MVVIVLSQLRVLLPWLSQCINDRAITRHVHLSQSPFEHIVGGKLDTGSRPESGL